MREFFYEVIHNFKRAGKDFFYMLKWFVIALLTGSFVGIVSVAFSWLDGRANSFRAENPWILYFLPIAGLLIIFLYHRAGVRKPGGTNKVISTLQADGSLPIRMSGLIFISTILTHLCGGSVGREGAALQLGGSLGACSKVIPEKWLDE
ncbi:MAG: chloride channel protein, partial [Lachnospiraceae bacterium]|nr:chloride channel protein [Lachnospiraceae bacterium]